MFTINSFGSGHTIFLKGEFNKIAPPLRPMTSLKRWQVSSLALKTLATSRGESLCSVAGCVTLACYSQFLSPY